MLNLGGKESWKGDSLPFDWRLNILLPVRNQITDGM